ncbi:hypothetical protein HanPSC8_Chr16g0746931 [Helianthus annuus]|nr:hypothetical protein HanPSC8_Chr16g0746931 [Helianthus annuus]
MACATPLHINSYPDKLGNDLYYDCVKQLGPANIDYRAGPKYSLNTLSNISPNSTTQKQLEWLMNPID